MVGKNKNENEREIKRQTRQDRKQHTA